MGSTHISRPKALALGVIALWIAAQFIPVDRTNPPVAGDLEVSGEVAAVLRRACYDCHSHETHWPWYGYLAPPSWLLARNVHRGRAALNFSTWSAYDTAEAAALAKASASAAANRTLPPRLHTWLTPSAALDAEERAMLGTWAKEYTSTRAAP